MSSPVLSCFVYVSVHPQSMANSWLLTDRQSHRSFARSKVPHPSVAKLAQETTRAGLKRLIFDLLKCTSTTPAHSTTRLPMQSALSESLGNQTSKTQHTIEHLHTQHNTRALCTILAHRMSSVLRSLLFQVLPSAHAQICTTRSSPDMGVPPKEIQDTGPCLSLCFPI